MVLLAAMVLACLTTAPSPARAEEDEYPQNEPAFEEAQFAGLRGGLRDAPRSFATVPEFQRVFRDDAVERRVQAVRDLGRRGNVAAIPHVGAVLLRLNEPREVRLEAAAALGRIGEARVREYLSEALTDPDVRVRMAGVEALARAAPMGAETLIEKKLRTDPSWWVRYAAAIALGRLREPFSFGALARASREDKESRVRLQAALALAELGTPRAAEALGASLKDEDPGVRVASALGLGRIGGERALDLLQAEFAREDDELMRRTLAIAVRNAASVSRGDERQVQRPDQKEDEGRVHDELQGGVAHDVARLEAKDP